MSDVVQLVTTRPDAEVAADLRKRIEAAMTPLLDLFAEAAKAGFLVEWNGIAPDAFGRFRVNGLRFTKHF